MTQSGSQEDVMDRYDFFVSLFGINTRIDFRNEGSGKSAKLTEMQMQDEGLGKDPCSNRDEQMVGEVLW